MLATVRRVADRNDTAALEEFWRLLGGDRPLLGPQTTDPMPRIALLHDLIHTTCGKGDPYVAERAALVELADVVGVNASQFAEVEDLEDAVVDAAASRLTKGLASDDDSERQERVEEAVRRLSDEDRIRLIEQVLSGLDCVPDRRRKRFAGRLANGLSVTQSAIEDALLAGTPGLLQLATKTGHDSPTFFLSVQVMDGVIFDWASPRSGEEMSVWLKTADCLLGPFSVLLAIAARAGWFPKEARRQARFRKLLQLAARCSVWRHENEGGARVIAAPRKQG